MSEMIVVISLALAFTVLLVWLLRPRRHSAVAGRPGIDRALESTFPKHYRFFGQVRQALSAGDNEYLRGVAPPHVARQVLRERRGIAKHFLYGLHEDFSGLERLARMVASLSPVLSREQEMERLYLGLKFRMLYVMVWLHLSTGQVPLQQLEHLTELVGRLALRMEQAMAEISALSADHLPSSLKA
jgi:hypothetical protein